MTITSTGLDLAGTVFGAINRAPQAEGVCDSEALSARGARLPAVIPTRPRPPGGAGETSPVRLTVFTSER